MRNHHQKTRDMARSILPSSFRRQAKIAKANSNRVFRRHEQHQLHDLNRFLRVHDFDDYEAHLHDPRRPDDSWSTAQLTFDGLLSDRRDADKVAPLIRWAQAHVERDPRLRDGDLRLRRTHFARILGPTLIGRHALGHLRDVLDPE